MSKTWWTLILLAFVVPSVIFAFSYGSVIVADYEQGEIISQIQLTAFEYNSSELQTEAESTESFECNITIENPSNLSVILLSISVTHYRKVPSILYLIAHGSYSYNLALAQGYHRFAVKIYYTPYSEKPPPSTPTIPTFEIEIGGKYGFSARVLAATVSYSTVEDTSVEARPPEDETYVLLFIYPSLIISSWTLGIATILIVGLVKFEKQKTEPLAAANFLLLALFIASTFLLGFLRYPPPYRTGIFIPPASGGIAGLAIVTQFFLIIVIFLSMATAIGLFLHQRWARILAAVTFVQFLLHAYTNILLVTPSFGGTGGEVLQVSFAMISITTGITLFKLFRLGNTMKQHMLP